MRYTRTGLILCTENYEECVEFYSDILDLPVLNSLDNEHSKLTCFGMGGDNYLMIETGGTSIPAGKTLDQNPVWLRFNVEDVEKAANELRRKGVDAKLRKEVWGTVADVVDPDGNFCSFRDEATFSEDELEQRSQLTR